MVLFCEILLLFPVGFLPDRWNLPANAMVSFACAMQVQAFRKVNGYAFASTMCIGNMRSGMKSLCAYRQTHHHADIHKALRDLEIIFLFALGAGIGGRLLAMLEAYTIWISCFLLFISLSLMFIKDEVAGHPEIKREGEEILSDIKDIREKLHNIEQEIK